MRHYLFLFLIFVCGCSRIPPHTASGLSVIHHHQEEMYEKHDWLPQSKGGSFSEDQVRKLSTSFDIILNNYDIDETRRLLLEGAEKFLEEINRDPQLLPHLAHHPFTFKDIKYSLLVISPDDRLIGHTFLMQGNAIFSAANEYEELYRVHEEPYVEACEKVFGKQPQIIRAPSSPPKAESETTLY